MKMWKTRWNKVTEVEVDRVSESFVWVNGRRYAIRTSYDTYHKTFEDAKAFLITEAEAAVARKNHALNRAKETLAAVMFLEPPEQAGDSIE